jgi:hypothetical protein
LDSFGQLNFILQNKENSLPWAKQVKDRLKNWMTNRTTQASSPAQLEWEANVVEYVNYMYSLTKVHGNATKNTVPPVVPKGIPVWGPRFVPPTYIHLHKRSSAPEISPDTAYLKPLNIVHPFYFPGLAKCPKCHSVHVTWEGWTGTGSREVHGVNEEEFALGYQLRCKDCQAAGGSTKFCVTTTNPVFWEKWEHWEIPRKHSSSERRRAAY